MAVHVLQRNPSTACWSKGEAVAKVGRKWRNFSFSGSEFRTVGGNQDEKLGSEQESGKVPNWRRFELSAFSDVL